VTVKRTGENDDGPINRPGPGTVAAADLNVPESAKREYEKSAVPFNKGDWKKAKEQMLKAIAIYPEYATAYNDLGVVYGRLGDRVHEREALQKAVSLNDHFAEAYVNLGKMAIADHNFPQAEGFLNKASGSDPSNPQTLMLLANVQLMNQHFDESVANCHKVHSLPHKLQTLVHYIAARALMHQNRSAEALTELQTFLTEEPSGPRADVVRVEIGQLQGHN
jgi:tetratricopeptide (TPR) repeat protein